MGLKYITSLIAIAILIAPLNAQTLKSSEVLELALSSPVYMEKSTAKLSIALGELEEARKWWLPSTAFGAQTFNRNGNAMNAEGEILTGVEQHTTNLAWDLRFNADAGLGLTAVKSANHSYEATLQEVKSGRDQFVLKCMEACISIVAAKRDLDYHLSTTNELIVFEEEYLNLFELGLRPQSDALVAKSERLQLESQCNNIHSSIALMEAELRYALGLSKSPNVEKVWPEINSSLSSEYYGVLPARSALEERREVAVQNAKGINRDIWMPELRFSPTLSGFGGEFSSISPTTQWIAALAWTFPISNLGEGGQRRILESSVDLAYAEENNWDLLHYSRIDGLKKQINYLASSLFFATEAVTVSDLAMSQINERQDLGLVDPVELVQILRLRLDAHSNAISIKEALLISEFRLQLELGATW